MVQLKKHNKTIAENAAQQFKFPIDRTSRQLLCLVVCHVDDFVYGGNELFHTNVVEKLRSIFIVGTEQSRCFKFLGIDIDCTDDVIKLSMQTYTN